MSGSIDGNKPTLPPGATGATQGATLPPTHTPAIAAARGPAAANAIDATPDSISVAGTSPLDALYGNLHIQLPKVAPPQITLTAEVAESAKSFANNIDALDLASLLSPFERKARGKTGSATQAGHAPPPQTERRFLRDDHSPDELFDLLTQDPAVGRTTQQTTGATRLPQSSADGKHGSVTTDGIGAPRSASLGPEQQMAAIKEALLEAGFEESNAMDLIAIFLKLQLIDPNNSVKTQETLHNLATKLRQSNIEVEKQKNVEAQEKIDKALAKAKRMKLLATIITVIMVAVTILIAALTGGAALAIAAAAIIAASMLIATIVAAAKGKDIKAAVMEGMSWGSLAAGLFTGGAAALGAISTRAAAQAAKVAAQKTAEQASKQAVNESTKQAVKQAAEQAVQESSRQAAAVASKASSKVAEQMSTTVAKRMGSETARGASQQQIKQAGEQAIEEIVQKTVKQSMTQATAKSQKALADAVTKEITKAQSKTLDAMATATTKEIAKTAAKEGGAGFFARRGAEQALRGPRQLPVKKLILGAAAFQSSMQVAKASAELQATRASLASQETQLEAKQHRMIAELFQEIIEEAGKAMEQIMEAKNLTFEAVIDMIARKLGVNMQLQSAQMTGLR